MLRLMIVLASLVVALTAVATPAAAAGPTLTLYSVSGFGGQSIQLGSDVFDLNLNGWGDITSSLRWSAGQPPVKASLYSDVSYAGTCLELSAADQSIPDMASLLGRPVGNDAISSVRIGQGCPTATVTLYEDNDFGGKAKMLSETVPDLTHQNFNDVASSATNTTGGPVRIWSASNFTDLCANLDDSVPNLAATPIGKDSASSVDFGRSCGTEIVLYENTKFNSAIQSCQGLACLVADKKKGEHFALSSNEDLFWLKTCLKSGCDQDLAQTTYCTTLECHSFNDKASSILLPYGGIAAVFRDAHYQGTCQTITESITDLSNTVIGNDAISSVAVERGCATALYLFTNADRSGGVLQTTSDVVDSAGYNGLNDTFHLPSPAAYVSIYTGPYFSGTCQPSGVNPSIPGIRSISLGLACHSPGLILYPAPDYTGAAPDYAGTTVDVTATTNDASTLNIVPRSLVNSTSQTLSVYAKTNRQGACVNIPATSGIPDLAQTELGDAPVASIAFSACPPDPVLTLTPTCPPSVPSCFAISYRIPIVADIPVMASQDNDAATAITNYSNGTMSLYRDFNYQGVCQNVPPGASSDLANSVVGAFTVSSIKLSGPCPPQLELFANTNFGGATLFTSVNRADLSSAGFARITSSLVNNSSALVASVYSLPNYQGRCQTIQPGQALRTLAGSEVGNNNVVSVQFGTACRSAVGLYPATQFRGHPLSVVGDAPGLAVVGFDQVAVSLANNTNRTISVYSEPNYGGRCQNVLPQTAIGNLANSVVHSKAVRSVKVSMGCPPALLLFPQANFSGQPISLPAGGVFFDLSTARATSLVNNTAAQWAVYEGAGFLGRCQTIFPGQTIPNLNAPRSIGPHFILSAKFNAVC